MVVFFFNDIHLSTVNIVLILVSKLVALLSNFQFISVHVLQLSFSLVIL